MIFKEVRSQKSRSQKFVREEFDRMPFVGRRNIRFLRSRLFVYTPSFSKNRMIDSIPR